jgi:xylulokinase
VYLGLDLGTSAVKACLLDETGGVVETASARLAIDFPFEGASEQACESWWTATRDAINRLDPVLRGRVKGVGLSGQMHGAVLLDAAKQPLRPAILWNDARAAQECEDLLRIIPDIGDRTGVYPMAGFTAPKLMWLATHEPETHAKIAHILLPKDYIGLRLHGELATDFSDASGTSWMDQRSRQWSAEICQASATDIGWLPRILNGSDIAGTLHPSSASELGLTSGIPVVAGAGDAAAGAIGIGAIGDGDGFLSLGTSGQLFVTTKDYRPNVENRIHAYSHTLPDVWFQMAAMLNGARPLAWLSELLGRPIEALLAEAENAGKSPIFLPYLTGERTPHGDTDIRAGFFGLSETTTHGELMRAVVEAVAFSFADANQALEAAGTKTQSLLAIGGGTQSDLLMRTIATVTNCEIGRSGSADVGPALGAARLAMLAVGKDDAATVMQKPSVETWFTPEKDAQVMLTDKLTVYRALYPAVKAAQRANTQ